jgi:hypothetical protein
MSICYLYKTFLGRSQTPSSPQPRKSFSSPNSPLSKEKSGGNPSRGRQLWNLAVESVIDHDQTTLTPMTSSTAGNEPMGWYNLTKR